MEIIAMILSGLALLAAGMCLCMLAHEKKRNQERNAAMVKYVDATFSESVDRIEKLEQGITPDYEQAKAAADAVNDFNKGISNILGFDPVAALQAERQKERTGDPN